MIAALLFLAALSVLTLITSLSGIASLVMLASRDRRVFVPAFAALASFAGLMAIYIAGPALFL